MAKTNPFLKWAKEIVGERSLLDDWTEDFIHDALGDKKFPAEDDYRTIHRYLQHRACTEACEAFDELWHVYRPTDCIDKEALTDYQRGVVAFLQNDLSCTPKQALTICRDIYEKAGEWHKSEPMSEGIKVLTELWATDSYRKLRHEQITCIAYAPPHVLIYAERDEKYNSSDNAERVEEKHSWDYNEKDWQTDY